METKERTEENTTENSSPLEGEGAGVDELATRLSEDVPEDIAHFIAENWQRIFGGFALALLGIVLYYEYVGAGIEKQQRAGEKFSEVQNFYRVLNGVSEEDLDAKTQAQRGFEDTISLLQKTYPGSTYTKFSELYRAAEFLQTKNIAAAVEVLEQYDVDKFKNIQGVQVGVSLTGEQLASELASLLFVRLLLEQPDSDLGEVRARLIGMARGGQVVAPEALTILGRISTREAERKETMDIAKEVTTARPEIAALIQEGLSSVGIVLPE